uniref:Protein kinase domain-containing protein n=1 Tax=Leersia perrieri TaxID=77586 RepID=A0A0D9XQH3_9ORYZ
MVAVKKLCLDSKVTIEDTPFQEEVACLMRTKHKNIVRFLGYCADTQGIMTKYEGRYVLADERVRLLCFEFVRNGSLDRLVTDEFGGLGWPERYRIIKGICQGLRYLHEERKIVHLDLKPQNILLDQNNVPKITDFGLSRLFDEQKTRTITLEQRGTRGYMSPEYIEGGLITFKADIFSLGVIILEVISGKERRTENVHKNWMNRLQRTLSYTSAEAYSQQVQRCIEIASICKEPDIHKRPCIGDVISMLNATEVGCQEDEAVTSPELLGIHPAELRFAFEPNKLIPCSLHLTNSTNYRVAFRIHPGSPERYFTEWLCGVVPPMSTYTLIVVMKEREQPLLDMDEFMMEQSIIMADEELKFISQGKADTEYNTFFTEIEEKGVVKVKEQKLTVVCGVCDPRGKTTSEIMSTMDFDKMVTMDVHPTKPWIITGHFNGDICIWNHQTKKMVNSFEVTREQEVLTAKFVSRKQWIVAGGGDGRIFVYNYDTMKKVTSFKALSNQITSLAIHPTQPYVLSASYDLIIKLWDWENDWKCSRVFKEEHQSSVMQIAFNPRDTTVFASVSKDKTLKIWSVDSPRSKLTLPGHSSNIRCLDYFTSGDKQYVITGSDDCTAKIWDMQIKRCVRTLEGHANRVTAVCSHPELPILMTGSRDGTVRLWNSNTFRLEGILNFGLRKVHALGCMKGSRRNVTGGERIPT